MRPRFRLSWCAKDLRCPDCGGCEFAVTCMGTFQRDTNRASCRCGWRGLVDDCATRYALVKVERVA